MVTEALEHFAVFAEIALEGKDADATRPSRVHQRAPLRARRQAMQWRRLEPAFSVGRRGCIPMFVGPV